LGGIRTYGPYVVLEAGDMSADVASAAIDMLSLPFGALEAAWTGSPVGTFSVDGSIQNVASADLVTTWYPTGTAIEDPAGAAGSTLINLSGVGFRWLRLSYTRTSGTGSLTVTAFGKGAGGGGL
jgi:hypothetical protein